MAEENDDLLLREIEEEMRQERALKVWKRYGSYFIVAGAAIVLGVAGWQYRQQEDRAERERLGQILFSAQQIAESAPARALQAIETLRNLKGGYGLLARFEEAGLLAAQGDHEGAADAFRAISGAAETPELYKGYAAILTAIHTMSAGGDLDALKGRLAPLDAANEAWRHSARELLGVIALEENDKTAARGYFQEIADDDEAPRRMRLRATELLTILQ